MERKNKTNRDISSFIPTLRAGQEAGTKGMPEKSGTPTALVRHAAPDYCSLQLISALQNSSQVPGFPGGAGDTQTAAEHPWLAPSNTALSHSQESFKHSSMESFIPWQSLSSLTLLIFGGTNGTGGLVWCHEAKKISVPRIGVPGINSIWECYSLLCWLSAIPTRDGLTAAAPLSQLSAPPFALCAVADPVISSRVRSRE